MNKLILIYTVILFSACSSQKGHSLPVPDTNFVSSSVHGQKSQEYRNALLLGRKMVKANIRPIYLFIESDSHMRDETGNGAGTLPHTIRRATMFAAFDFRPKVQVYTSIGKYARLLQNPRLADTAFEIEGAITSFDENNEVIDSGIDFGLDIGKGKGETDGDSKFRNTDKVSSITLEIMFKQDGQMYSARTQTLDIKYVNRGYSFGLRINNSGFGATAYHTKKEGIGQTIKRLLHYTLHSMLQEVIQRKNLIKTRKNSIKSARNKKKSNKMYKKKYSKHKIKASKEVEYNEDFYNGKKYSY